MPKFRKKPVVVEAEQYIYGRTDEMSEDFRHSLCTCQKAPLYHIHTLEGEHHVSNYDWIIRGVNGEFYPCKPDIFAKTYEPAE